MAALAVMTCMDARIDPLGPLGLRLGDAFVLRNAGVQVNDHVLADLALARDVLGVTELRMVAHTDCRANGSDDAKAIAVAQAGAERIRAAVPGLTVTVEVLDLSSGAVRPA